MTWRGDTETFEQMVDRKRSGRMRTVDAMSPELRALVNEYGYNIVHNFMQLGVRKPNQIRYLVEMVLDEFSPTRGCHSQQGIRTEVVRHLREPEA